MRASPNDPGKMADTTAPVTGGSTPLQTHQNKVGSRDAKTNQSYRHTAQNIYPLHPEEGGIFLSRILYTQCV